MGSVAVEDLAQLLVVGVALGDRVLEDRRVGRDALDALADEAREIAVLDERAREGVDPHALAVVRELGERGVRHGASYEGSRGMSGVTGEDDKRALPESATRAEAVQNGRCQRVRPASSRSQAATACSSRLASRRRAARAWLAVTELVRGPDWGTLAGVRPWTNRPGRRAS